MPNAITTPTESYGSVEGFTHAYIVNEIADTRNSALDHQIFTTVNNDLKAAEGDIYHVDRVVASGAAEDVAEGAGNQNKIATTTAQVDYTVKTAQSWFQYTDERLRRTPESVTAGISHLGISIFNKINEEVIEQLGETELVLDPAPTTLNFDAVVDAQNLLDLDVSESDEGANSDAILPPQTMLLVGKKLRAAIRKACKDELQYVEAYVRTGYVGTLAGTNVYYSKLMDDTELMNTAFLFTSKAVTTFIKADVEVEESVKGNRSAEDANTRMNNVFARQVYVVALTDGTKAAKITIGS